MMYYPKSACLKVMLDNGVLANITDSNNATSLMLSMYSFTQINTWDEGLATTKLLLNAGVNPDALDINGIFMIIDNDFVGRTALFYACNYMQYGAGNKFRYAMIYTILMAGANPDIVDSQKKTALMYAVTNGDVSLVYSLLEYGADPRISVNGMTAYNYSNSFNQGTIQSAISVWNVLITANNSDYINFYVNSYSPDIQTPSGFSILFYFILNHL